MIDTLMSWLGATNGDHSQVWVQLLQIVWIDLLLAGDNAVVIALACRGLPEHQRKWGIMLGSGLAILMRIAFAGVVTVLMTMPWLKMIGSVLLIWVAVKMLAPGAHDENPNIKGTSSLWGAVGTIGVADLVMSLDNVIAIAGAAKGNVNLIAIGLIISIPLIVGGATLLMSLLTRFPILIWAGAALLGWIAGELAVADPAVAPRAAAFATQIGITTSTLGHIAAAIGALIVVLLGWIVRSGGRSATDMRSEASG